MALVSGPYCIYAMEEIFQTYRHNFLYEHHVKAIHNTGSSDAILVAWTYFPLHLQLFGSCAFKIESCVFGETEIANHVMPWNHILDTLHLLTSLQWYVSIMKKPLLSYNAFLSTLIQVSAPWFGTLIHFLDFFLEQPFSSSVDWSLRHEWFPLSLIISILDSWWKETSWT